MLPFGHIAAGYLLSEGFLFFVKPPVSPHEAQWLVGIGTFSSFAPDLDMFHASLKKASCSTEAETGGTAVISHMRRSYGSPSDFLSRFSGEAFFG